MKHGLFVTGTDTGIGKTVVTALLLRGLQRRGIDASAFKPFACGTSSRDDARLYAALLANRFSLEQINPVWLRKPLAPWVAAKLEHRRIDLALVRRQFRAWGRQTEFILVEGAGGWLVPITRDYRMRELARDFGLPVLVVARPGLGTLNHTLLTVESIRAANLPVAGIVLNHATSQRAGLAERTNAAALRELTGAPVFSMPYSGSLAASVTGVEKAWRQPRIALVIGRILSQL